MFANDLANDLVNQAVAWMLTYLLHSTLLLGLAWLVSKPLSRWSVAAEEAVWKLALVGAIFTASLQFATGWEPVAGRWRLADLSVATLNEDVGAGLVPAPALRGEDLRMTLRSSEASRPLAEAPAAAKTALPSLSSLALGAWLVGMLALLAVHGASYLRLRRRLRPRPRVVGGTLFSQLRRLALEAGMAEEVRLTCSSRVPVPLAFQSEICVPPRALASLTDEQQEGMLAHELAHLVRRDPFWLVVSQAVSCLLFFQPLNWVARRRLREISEMLSDEWAVSRTGRPLSLAGCLAEVAGWSYAGRALPVPGMADRPSNLARRIRRLLDETRSPERPARRYWLGAAMVVLVVAVAAAAPAVSAARAESPAAPEEPVAVTEPDEPLALADATIAEPEQEADVEADSEDPGEIDIDVDVDPEVDPDDIDVGFDFDFDFDSSFEPELGEVIAEAMASVDAALDSMDLDYEGYEGDQDGDDYRSLTPEEREKLERRIEESTRKIEQTLKPRMEQLSREMSEKMSRLHTDSAEMQRLQAEMEKLAEQMRPSEEEMARLHAEIRKLHEDRRPLSDEERKEIARQAREMAERVKPTEEQRRQMQKLAAEMRKHQREFAERFRAEHIEEITKAQREMRQEIEREMQAVREELRRTREEHRLRMREDRREHERRKEIRKEREKEREDGDEKPPKVSVRLRPDPRVFVRIDPNPQIEVCAEAKDSSGR